MPCGSHWNHHADCATCVAIQAEQDAKAILRAQEANERAVRDQIKVQEANERAVRDQIRELEGQARNAKERHDQISTLMKEIKDLKTQLGQSASPTTQAPGNQTKPPVVRQTKTRTRSQELLLAICNVAAFFASISLLVVLSYNQNGIEAKWPETDLNNVFGTAYILLFAAVVLSIYLGLQAIRRRRKIRPDRQSQR